MCLGHSLTSTDLSVCDAEVCFLFQYLPVLWEFPAELYFGCVIVDDSSCLSHSARYFVCSLVGTQRPSPYQEPSVKQASFIMALQYRTT